MRLLVAIGVLALAFAGCVTPSIPIPPPDPAKMKFTVEQLQEDSHAEDFAQMLRHWLDRSGRTPQSDA